MTTLRVTPAMEAGLTDHVWSIAELLATAQNCRRRLETQLEIPYIVTHCPRGHRTQFPQSMIEPPSEHLAVPPAGSLAVTVSCCMCRHVDNHEIENRPTHIGTEDTVEYQTQRPVFGFVYALRCATPGCTIPLEVVAIRKTVMTPEERAADVSIWEWDELRCPSGYLIPKPEKEQDDSR